MGVVALAAAALAMAAGLAPPAGDGAQGACELDSSGSSLTVRVSSRVELRVGAGGAVTADGEACGPATIEGLQRLRVLGGSGGQRVELGPAASFGGARVVVALGAGGRDALRVAGGADDDRVELGEAGLRLAAGGPSDSLRGVERVRVDGGPGADSLDADGYRRPLELRGGPGPDELAGGRDRDRIKGGDGVDRIEGGRRADRLDGGPGDDRCWGGPGADVLASCRPAFAGAVEATGERTRRRMSGRSWHRGCPVGLGDLRVLRLRHWDFGRDVQNGRLVVHEDQAKRVLGAMRSIYLARFPIRRIRPIDAYGGDDQRSMNADNTSAFNCRFVAGSPGVWSQHAYGRAIDVNPIENPYVTPSGHVSPPAGRPYADRSRDAEGMIHRGDRVEHAFRRIGWEWGGRWPGTRDYQHFSSNGH